MRLTAEPQQNMAAAIAQIESIRAREAILDDAKEIGQAVCKALRQGCRYKATWRGWRVLITSQGAYITPPSKIVGMPNVTCLRVEIRQLIAQANLNVALVNGDYVAILEVA